MTDKLDNVENSDMDQIMLPNNYSPHVSTNSEEHNDFMPKKRSNPDSEEVAGSSWIHQTLRQQYWRAKVRMLAVERTETAREATKN